MVSAAQSMWLCAEDLLGTTRTNDAHVIGVNPLFLVN